jgi:ATP-dependent DNA helicase RecQ
MNRNDAETLLKTALDDPTAKFRDGQWEAIDALVNQRRNLLVVQRTGWGKSSVYFISAALLRQQGRGLTVIISPLLALMRNQIDAAGRLGLNALTLNSTNREDHNRMQAVILADEVDCLLISPERLANEDFVESVLQPITNRIALLVVDEAHCISDWGHDFRPDYRRLTNVLRLLPPTMPVLATTATANDRVIEDVQNQLGDFEVLRGSLVRDSLQLQNLLLPDQGSRLAWLATQIPLLHGTGIVYVLTKRDAEQVKDWLLSNGIDAMAYYSGIEHPDFQDSNALRLHLEDLLLNNQIKVLVATVALGMGYDKPDLGFVIHYQAPGSIVGYYQQVGRAGRGISVAYGVLLSGREDADIHEYFRSSAFPSEDQVQAVLELLEQHDGVTLLQLQQELNLRQGQLDKVLKYLSVENPSPVIKEGSRWQRTPVAYRLDRDRIARLTAQREVEWEEVQTYLRYQNCLMEFLRRALDDPQAQLCGRCANCLGRTLFPIPVPHQMIVSALQFMRHSEFDFEPRKQVAANAFPVYGFKGNLPPALRSEPGKILSRWNDAGWGSVVANDKRQGRFSDELVNAIVEMIQQRWQPSPSPTWACCVPSRLHPDLVPDFAQRLASALCLPFVAAIHKIKNNQAQKMQNNRYHQCRNLDGVFALDDAIPAGPVLLIDDIIDSGWTVTVLAALLRRNGSGPVYPLALASTSTGD